MEMPWDYEEVANWFLNDEGLYTLAMGAQSGKDLFDLCNDCGYLQVGDVTITACNVRYAWDCVHDQ